MTTPILHRAESLAATWREDAKKRRRMSQADAAADVLDYCADELLSELRSISGDDDEISVADYAAMHGKAASTVRRWCHTGALPCQQKGREYMIRRGEPCPKLAAA